MNSSYVTWLKRLSHDRCNLTSLSPACLKLMSSGTGEALTVWNNVSKMLFRCGTTASRCTYISIRSHGRLKWPESDSVPDMLDFFQDSVSSTNHIESGYFNQTSASFISDYKFKMFANETVVWTSMRPVLEHIVTSLWTDILRKVMGSMGYSGWNKYEGRVS